MPFNAVCDMKLMLKIHLTFYRLGKYIGPEAYAQHVEAVRFEKGFVGPANAMTEYTK